MTVCAESLSRHTDGVATHDGIEVHVAGLLPGERGNTPRPRTGSRVDGDACCGCHRTGLRTRSACETSVNSGVFEVLDLRVDSEHHNDVAAGVLVHNKTFDETLNPVLSGTSSATDGDTDSTGEQLPTGGDTAEEPTESSSGTGGSGSETTGSSDDSAGPRSAAGSSGISGSSGTTGG